jgi:hypothetical protein
LYNAQRVRLSTMLREIDRLTSGSYCNNVPIFYCKSTNPNMHKFVKFPVFVCTNSNMNKYLENMVGENQLYFKIPLMRLSLEDLRLTRYCTPPLARGEQMTHQTNPIPHDQCPIGTQPERNMYSDESLIKNWDIQTHLECFEKAIYKVTMNRELIRDYNNLMEIRKELYLKIKIQNLKSDTLINHNTY